MAHDVMQLSEDQVAAIAAIRDWWQRGDRQTFSLAGYAGTGKTTVISAMLREHEGRVIVAAPTGKAALRLRQKGVRATTIHQLAYRFEGRDEQGQPLFDYTGIAAGDALVVIDEASMVNTRIHQDLVSGGYRMLFVGDHGQLPPVGGDPGIMRKPDFALSVIHRQDDAGLLDFAHGLREGRYLPEARGNVQKTWLHPMQDQPHVVEALRLADTVLCYRNQTRHRLNLRIMAELGLIDRSFAVGKTKDIQARSRELLLSLVGKRFRVVGLKNDHRLGFFNGQVAELELLEAGDVLRAMLIPEEGAGSPAEVIVDPSGFLRDDRGLDSPPRTLVVDFGYCLTAHKSQGSEWPFVVVYDDTYTGMEERARWCYTAATRAKDRLTWLHR